MVAPEPLARWLVESFALPAPVTVRLLRAYTNDVYAVETPGARYALKIYGSGWRTAPEIRYEMALLQHLQSRGLRLAAPVPGSDGELLRKLPALEPGGETRGAVLFKWAAGEKPRPPFSPSLYERFGRAIGTMHSLSGDFRCALERRPLDLQTLIDGPLEVAAPLIADASQKSALLSTAARVSAKMTELAADLDWGPIHGDASLDNLHIDSDGEVVLYDFDSGGPGWRAADLQGWAAGDPAYRKKWDAFLGGYQSARPLRSVDLQAGPYLTLAWDIWGLTIDLEQRVLKQGSEAVRRFLADQVTRIQQREQALFPGGHSRPFPTGR